MSTNINLIEISNLSYIDLITIVNKDPVHHLEEVPFGNFQLELDLCDEVYETSEYLGYTKCYTARVNGNYAGYIIRMASEMIHHANQLQAVTDSFYIRPEYRACGVFSALLTHVESDLKDNGIRFLTLGMNPNMPHAEGMTEFVQTRGYVHTETLMTKELL